MEVSMQCSQFFKIIIVNIAITYPCTCKDNKIVFLIEYNGVKSAKNTICHCF
jgi:hypothetical protein